VAEPGVRIDPPPAGTGEVARSAPVVEAGRPAGSRLASDPVGPAARPSTAAPPFDAPLVEPAPVDAPGVDAPGGDAPALARRRVSRLNAANILTLVRLVLVVPFVLALFAGGGHRVDWRLAATALFVVAAVTDRLDGQLARRHGWVTDLGTFADPLADKALTGSALVGLSILHLVPWWLTVVVVVREVLITVLRSVLARIAAIPASRGGKLKTLLLTVGLGLVLLPVADAGVVHGVGLGVLVAAAAVSTVTGVEYVIAGRRLYRGRPSHRR